MTINNDNELKQILKTIKIIASVGVSSNEEKPSYWIFNYLMVHGYQMIPVNPTASEILWFKGLSRLDIHIAEDRCSPSVSKTARCSAGCGAGNSDRRENRLDARRNRQ